MLSESDRSGYLMCSCVRAQVIDDVTVRGHGCNTQQWGSYGRAGTATAVSVCQSISTQLLKCPLQSQAYGPVNDLVTKS